MLIHNVTGLCILTLHHSLIPLVLRFEGNVDAVDVVSVEVNYSPSAAQAVVFRLIARVYSKWLMSWACLFKKVAKTKTGCSFARTLTKIISDKIHQNYKSFLWLLPKTVLHFRLLKLCFQTQTSCFSDRVLWLMMEVSTSLLPWRLPPVHSSCHHLHTPPLIGEANHMFPWRSTNFCFGVPVDAFQGPRAQRPHYCSGTCLLLEPLPGPPQPFFLFWKGALSTPASVCNLHVDPCWPY